MKGGITLLIMNEVKVAEDIIKGKIGEFSPANVIGILSKYYTQIQNKSNKEIKNLIISCLIKNWKCINVSEWDSFIDKAIKNGDKYPINKVSKIPITKNEIDTIKKIPIKRQQKLAFAYLVMAKFNCIVNGSTWVNESMDMVMKAANISWINTSKRDYDIHDLYKMKLITLPKRIDKVNIKVEFIDMEGKEVFNVMSLKNLGKIWCYHESVDKKICIDCGNPFEVCGTARRTKVRCDECQHERIKINNKIYKNDYKIH